jgi:hypothetical protein
MLGQLGNHSQRNAGSQELKSHKAYDKKIRALTSEKTRKTS